MIFNYFDGEKKLLFVEHGVEEIPEEVLAEYSDKEVVQVDFSSNFLVSLDCLTYFSSLEEVIFDNNFLSDTTIFPKRNFPNVVVLSINNNKFENLSQLLQNLARCFPNLRFLSLLGNSLCPALLQDYNEEDYREYRLSIIRRMPKLKFLDAKQVDKNELLSIMQLSAASTSRSGPQSPPENSQVKMEKFGSLKKFFGFTPKTTNRSTVGQRDALTSPLPNDTMDASQSSQRSSYYGKVKSQYEGSQSQGNRFILNQDL